MIPTSTYRLQIDADFTLDDARGVLPYLAELGVGAVYLSPLLKAIPGSPHGYDWTDWRLVDPLRGGEDAWQRFKQAAADAGLGIVIDIVPNHMGIDVPAENPAWWDVLKHGQTSKFATWFDIDWELGPITIPVLADAEAAVDLRVEGEGEGAELVYFEHRYPLAPGSYSPGEEAASVHERQHYRLVGWRTARDTLSYRRFFAITGLAGLRVEAPEVFAATHARIRGWVAEGVVGLRVDHPDGLSDPSGYLQWLRELAPQAWLVVEKILEPSESLMSSWPVAGTSGYDAMREVNQVFVDPAGAEAFSADFARRTGDPCDFAAHARAGKAQVADELFTPEVRRIRRSLALPHPDEVVEMALAALAANFEVYRSYLPCGQEYLTAAVERVQVQHPALLPVLNDILPRLTDPQQEAAVRFQQLTGAVMAKGVEDTTYYRFGRFIALNEVGGDPATFGYDLDRFHAAMTDRQASLPLSMTALSTHDTKRGEDVRARLAVLAEGPSMWQGFLDAFVARSGIADAASAIFLAQTLAGVGRIDRERLHNYAVKAMREANQFTKWAEPNRDFESSLIRGIDLAFEDAVIAARWDELLAAIQQPGWSNGLGQKLVQLMMPGIPDVYQGTEIWEDSLVDPDNRRRVDFVALRTQLAGLTVPTTVPTTVDASGTAKHLVTRTVLNLRRGEPGLFTHYRRVAVVGAAANHVVAFDRGGVIAVATRLPIGLARLGGWGSTSLQVDGLWQDLLTGRTTDGSLAELLNDLPVALLNRV